MSLISMESWMSFPRFVGDNGNNTATNAARLAMAKSMPAAGYELQQANNTASWLVRPHPVFPDRAAIVFSAATASNGVQSAFRKKIGNGAGVVIGGFSLFVPSDFVQPAGNWSAIPALTIAASNDAGPMINVYGDGRLGINEIFRVRFDLGIGYGPAAVQSSAKITPGKISFIEYRLTNSEIRVWLNDTLVLQQSVSVDHSKIMFSAIDWQNMNGTMGQWAISDWYNLKEDAVPPNVRLGPSTRVIGVRAESDNFAQFARPAGFASNAAVVAQGLNPDTASFLKTDTVGAQDVYNPAEDSTTATAALVHAMSVKMVAQNMESTAHTMTPMLVSNGVAQGAPVALPANVGLIASVSTTDPNTGAAWTPAAAAAAKFGMKLET